MKLIDGWIDEAQKLVSPHYNQRPDAQNISLLVIHNISLPPNQFGNHYVEDFFCGHLESAEHPYFAEIAELKVSSHFYIKRDGHLVQFVSTLERAWHAGKSCFEACENCNDFSIGIELEGADDIAYTERQYQQLLLLTETIKQNFPAITKSRIVGHADIAPERKTDPGPAFDWQRYLARLD